MTQEDKTQSMEETTVETQVEEAAAAKPKKQSKYFRTAKGKRRSVVQVPKGRAYIQASLNNTIVTITDQNGNVLCWSSSGNAGFRGPKKSTPFAASRVVEKVAEGAQKYGVKELTVFVTGIGSGRDSAVRTLNAKGFNITSIKDVTPVAHNGCRARRPRRV